MLPPLTADLQAGCDVSSVCPERIHEIARRETVGVTGHKISVSLEEAFWDGPKEISGTRKVTLSDLISEIDNNRHESNLSSAIRLFVLSHFKSRAELGAVSSHAGEFSDIKPPSQHIAELR